MFTRLRQLCSNNQSQKAHLPPTSSGHQVQKPPCRTPDQDSLIIKTKEQGWVKADPSSQLLATSKCPVRTHLEADEQWLLCLERSYVFKNGVGAEVSYPRATQKGVRFTSPWGQSLLYRPLQICVATLALSPEGTVTCPEFCMHWIQSRRALLSSAKSKEEEKWPWPSHAFCQRRS